jgi:hypothetical protein
MPFSYALCIVCILPTKYIPTYYRWFVTQAVFNLDGVEDKKIVEVIIATHPMLKPHRNLLLPILRLDPHRRRKGRRLCIHPSFSITEHCREKKN